MDDTFWYKQAHDKPLFEELLWAKPETRAHAGKLLIIGGNSHALTAPGLAFSAATKAGIGSARVLLPDATKKTLGKVFPGAEFAPSTPSGSFSRQALAQFLESASWADGVLLAGDFGRNSETAILLETFSTKYRGQLTLAQDALDYFLHPGSIIVARPNTLLVINLGKLQKLAKNNRPATPILHNMNLHDLVTILADWTNSSPVGFITKHVGNLLAALQGKVSTTPNKTESNWQIELAACTSVWWLQQPKQPLGALTAATFSYLKS